ncbi:hypothetical protein [Alteribacillus bidgolensis]|uniref:Uncharacterized protein n=1 Tax=Alteribacillus bidgolensis TaxID=930129 RepID=A0A1G8E0G8_9BACI|nr:hypothetical protein [Alteribacillus bidgolensis]SDH63357.1 hypothetical protein SAMN05216352_10226 [Alteribacillus bidgolensis]
MSIFLTFFPIVLVLVLVTVRFKKRPLYGKGDLWLFGGYAAVLLFSSALFFLIAGEENGTEEEISAEIAEQEAQKLQAAAREGKDKSINKNYIKKQWTFEYDESQLSIETPDNNVNGTDILIERKEENDHVIEADYYQTPSSIEGKMAEPARNPSIQQTETALIIRKPEEDRLEYSAFKEEFPFNQGAEKINVFENSSLSLGSTLIYLRVPKDLDVNMDPYQVQYVNE